LTAVRNEYTGPPAAGVQEDFAPKAQLDETDYGWTRHGVNVQMQRFGTDVIEFDIITPWLRQRHDEVSVRN
jgi:hypothetical protein